MKNNTHTETIFERSSWTSAMYFCKFPKQQRIKKKNNGAKYTDIIISISKLYKMKNVSTDDADAHAFHLENDGAAAGGGVAVVKLL